MNTPLPPTLWTRRDLLTRSGWALLLASIVACVGAFVRLLFPRVRSEPPSMLVLGKPEEFAVGEVCERFKHKHSVILVRDQGGFFALRSVCTHLGCVPAWSPGQRKFKCPCHGSGFHRDGSNFEGPAPRPLERLAISLDDKNNLVVDTAVALRSERGEWTRRDAYLPFPTTSPTTSANRRQQ
jgi:cytochrome b6-f complex iron-sulfur subunit